MRYVIQYNGKAVASRGTVTDALACKTQRLKEATIASKTTKVAVAPYLWKVIDTHTGKEVTDEAAAPGSPRRAGRPRFMHSRFGVLPAR